MEYLVFEGQSYKEAYDQMYLKGYENNILDQMHIIRRVEEEKKSFFGLRKNKNFKIIVGVSRTRKPSRSSTTPDLFQTPSDTASSPSAAPSLRTAPVQPENEHLKKEVTHLKSSFEQLELFLKHQMSEIKDQMLQTQIHNNIQEDKKIIEDVEITTKNIKWAEQFLREREFASFLINDIIEYLKNEKKEVLLEKPQILASIRDFLLRNLVTEDLSIDNYNFGDTILLAGPTGVGKTITIVKMAAHIAAMRQKSMRFISVDRYKVGADSQIKTYSGYLQAPYYPIHKEEEFFDLVNKKESDFTFIDTAGKSPRETIAIQELGRWIEKCKNKVDVHLVVSATTKPADLDFIVEKYEQINFSHIIATKLDETLFTGSILSILYRTKKPLSFITNGQEVPEDFCVANIEKLVSDSIK